MSSRIYVIDSSVLLAEGKNALYSFGSDNVVLPLVVIGELESKRNDPDLGFQARTVLREISRLKGLGNIRTGVDLGKGYGEVRIEVNHVDTTGLPETIRNVKTNDIRILAVANALANEDNTDVILVTQDVTLQILASIVGLESMALEGPAQNDVDKYIKSVQEFDVASSVIDELYSVGYVHLSDVDVPMNTGILLKSHDNSALAIAKGSWRFEKVGETTIGSVSSKSKEQAIAIKHLMDPTIGVVSLGGRAGSGKSMLALAAALKLVADTKTPHNKIVVFRPINAVGGSEQELGFLPGTIDEKLAPIMQPVFDTIATFNNPIDAKKIKESGVIEFRSIAHARGSTLGNAIIIVDEVQNLSKSTIGTLLTRAGVGSRVFLCWDVNQTDAKYIGKFEGIFRIVRFLLGKKLFAHVSLIKSERSAVAEMASEILEDMI